MSGPVGVSIGKAAALYDLAPSTVRWWEAQRVLPKPPRVNGRRVYTEIELRRIGLAYLCCVTGVMPLKQAAVVTAGARNEHWRRTVKEHVGLLEERISELQSAREYLLHLRRCRDDDIVDQCPWLDGELMARTPRGRVPAQSFVVAAQSIQRRETSTPDQRDETAPQCDETFTSRTRCAVCAEPLTQPERGRRRRYCSRACQQRHHRQNARPSTEPSK